MGDQLRQLAAAGQSVWLDNIRRSMFSSGELHELVLAGLRGMTSNPTIFEKAIGSGSDYDAQLASLGDAESEPGALFEALAIDDIRHACDEFRAVYDASSGTDGLVSIEVSPLLARDARGTLEAAKRLWAAVDRPNAMIKIPATPECIPAISAALEAGINVNVTLIFSVETYEAVAVAYLEGLTARSAAGHAIDRIASVASVFVSRIDSAVDGLLQAKIAAGAPQLASGLGKTGVASMKLIYQRFKRLFEGERFESLRARGAYVQRPLWASTGTKNPAYSDLLYVESLVGKHTVNTMPPATLDALVAHGVVVPDTIEGDLDDARAVLERLAQAQISLFDVTEKLQADGVDSFAASYSAMLAALGAKREALRRGAGRSNVALGNQAVDIEAALAELSEQRFLVKLWTGDPSPWSADPNHAEIIKHALGWLDFPERVFERVAELRAFASDVAKRYECVVVLGMGGSSLTAGVLGTTFGHVAGFPQIHVLDSTAPEAVRALDGSLDLSATLFVVASKSGTTTEPEVFFRYFFDRVQKTIGADAAGKQFIAITDPGTSLAEEAKQLGFLRIFENDPDIGGRYSALSYFGMVPAALAGYDVQGLLDRGLDVLQANSRTTAVADAPAVRFGATIGALAKLGRDKLTIVAHPRIAAFGAWAEQLIAESTGKDGRGIVPVEGEPLGTPSEYGSDRVFVYVGQGLAAVETSRDGSGGLRDGAADEPDDVATIESRLHDLEAAGNPVIRLGMRDLLDLGAQFALWEIATATAGALLGVDAFDQPNVAESKENTRRLLAAYKATGAFAEPQPALATAAAGVFPLAGSRSLGLGDDLASALAALFAQVEAGDYVAFNAFLAMTPQRARQLCEIRLHVRNALKVATTVGFGPRFLHSTGQLHKGGPGSGIFLQLTADPPFDIDVPGMVSFAALLEAQALGDFEALDARGRRGARLHFTIPLESGLAQLREAIESAVMAKA